MKFKIFSHKSPPKNEPVTLIQHASESGGETSPAV